MPIFCFILTLISSYILIAFHLFHLANSILIPKSITSILFLVTALVSYKKNPKEPKLFRLIFTGLIFCFWGDFFLALAPNGEQVPFLLGIISFALGHIMYIISYSSLTKFTYKDLLIFTYIFIPTLATLLLVNFDFKGMLPFVIIYAILIIFMITKSLGLLKYAQHNTFAVTALITGSFLFFISDFILLFYCFYPSAPPLLQQCNWFLYYLGQALFSVSFLKGDFTLTYSQSFHTSGT